MTIFLITIFILLFFSVFLYIGHKGFPEKIQPLPPLPDENQLMDGGAPFFYEGKSDVAFLIIHGFTGTPYNVEPIGKFLHQKGHTTLGILLPGHGTKVEDMIPTRFYHYVAMADQYLLNLSKFYRRIFVIGFSMGGTIALKLALIRKNIINGIALISTPVFFNGFYFGRFIFHVPLMPFTGWIQYWKPVLYLKRANTEMRKEIRFKGYEFQYPLAALHSFKIALKSIRKRLHEISIPVAFIMNENDKTVPKESMYYILYHIGSAHKKAMFLRIEEPFDTGHAIIRNSKVQNQILKFLYEFFEDLISRSN